MNRTTWRVIRRVTGTALVVAVLGAAYVITTATGSDSWPQTIATVASRSSNNLVSPVPGAPFRRGETYVIRRSEASYEYMVGDVIYHGSGPTDQAGETITVYYSPHDPSISTPMPGIDFGALFAIAALAVPAWLLHHIAIGASGGQS